MSSNETKPGNDEVCTSPSEVKASTKPWVSLSRFEVRCQGYSNVTCPVYANGRQQIPIEIVIEARDEDGVVVDIPTDYSSLPLRMCEYEDPEAYPYRVGEAIVEDKKYVYGWQVQGAGDGYPDAHPTELGPAVVSGRAQVIRRWLYTDLVQTRKLAVRCTSPAGVTFVTNTPNPTAGKFDSYLIVSGREPKPLSWQSFTMSAPKQVVNNNEWNVMLYYVYFSDPSYRIVDFLTYRETERGAHFRFYGFHDKAVEHAAFPVGEEESRVYRSCSSSNRSVTFPINDRPGQANVARVWDYRGGAGYCYGGKVVNGLVGYIDQYGNESKVTLKVTNVGNGGFGSAIALDDPGNVDDLALPEEPDVADGKSI